MTKYIKEFTLEAADGHYDEYSAAREMAQDLGSGWLVFENAATGELIVCTEGEE